MRWHATTGLTDEQLTELTQRAHQHLDGWQQDRGRPRAVPFAQAVVLTLAILRHNLPQALVAELWGISQPTVSRIYQTLRRALRAVTEADAVGLADVEPDEQVLVDACLLPVGERAGHQELYSGKRHASGVNVHVVGDRAGRLIEVFGPVAGSTHDARSFAELGLSGALGPGPVAADLGYLGCAGVATPTRKPPGGALSTLERAANRAHNQARAAVERTIALLKQWRVLSTGYRGQLWAFPAVIRTAVALEKFRTYKQRF